MEEKTVSWEEKTMKKNIISMLVCMLLIATALPVTGMIYTRSESLTSENSIDVDPTVTSTTDVEWSKTYGGDESDRFVFVDQADDDGYFAGGSTEASNCPHPWLIKTDGNGNEEWSWEITEVSNDTMTFPIVDGDAYFGMQTEDGGYIACLHMIFEHDSIDWDIGGLVKLNATGNEIWFEYYAVDWEWSFIPVSILEEDDGYLTVGVSGYTAFPNDMKGMLLKTDFLGLEQWRKEYNYGSLDDQLFAIDQTDDDGYILTGWAEDETFEYWMVKTDSNGNEEWNATFGGDSEDYGHSRLCYQTTDGGYLMTGYTYSYGAGSADAWLVKTDENGNMEWDKTYGTSARDVSWSMEDMDDGGYVVCVTMNLQGMTGDKDDIHLVKIDEDGNIEWIRVCGGEGSQIANHIQQTSDDGFITAGRNGGYLSSSTDAMLVKFASVAANNAPETPNIDGPTEGAPETEYTYNFTAVDPDGGEIYYTIDWGDGTTEEWMGPYLSGTMLTLTHTYSEKGDYTIKCKAKDVFDEESDWGTLEISIPKNADETGLIKTFVWGTIRWPRIRSKTVTFRALNVHYRIFGQGERGVYKHQKLTFTNEFKGRISRGYICAIFDGEAT